MVTLLCFQLIFCRIELQVERAFFLLARLLPKFSTPTQLAMVMEEEKTAMEQMLRDPPQPRKLELENLKMQSISVEFQKRKQPRKQK